jgi:multidrug efflux pump subunit AcrB
LRWRAITLALCFALLILTMGYVFGRRIGIIMMPRVESDIAVVSAVLPFGSPNARAIAVSQQLSEDLQRATAKYGDRLIQGIFSVIDENKIEVIAMLTMPDIRPIGTRQVIMLWRDQLRPLPGLQSLRFEADRGGPGSGAALTIELSHSDIDTLKKASVDLAKSLSEFPNVKDIDDGYTPGKPQLDFRITKDGLSLGLTSAEIGRQVRNAFYGAQAGRQQRGRNEVRILVRLPEGERQSEYNIENLLIRIPSGSMVPLTQVAEVVRGRSYTSIERYNAQRIVTVTADVEPIGQVGQVMATLNQNIMPALMADYRGLTYRYAGRQADMQESMRGLLFGFILALIGIYFLLGIPFRSYIQPLIVMVAIPFGIVGAVIGHIIMDYNLSIMSMMGIIALSGVVVNDSLVLIDYANARRLEGYNAHDAIHTAGLRRFRPILITSLTTFGGLAPMIFETSRQARFMIPMAISLGYGILFATSIILVLVPSLYMLIDDITNFKASHKL